MSAVPRQSKEPAPEKRIPPFELVDCLFHYEVRVEMPGVRMKDLELSATERALKVAGERSGFHVRKRIRYELEVQFSEPIESARAKAFLEGGILEIEIDKNMERGRVLRRVPVGRGRGAWWDAGRRRLVGWLGGVRGWLVGGNRVPIAPCDP